jgi:hypothetical protein
MRPITGKRVVAAFSLLVVGLAGHKAMAIATSVTGEQFVVVCTGSSASCDSFRSNWKTTGWVGGINTNTVSMVVDGQLHVANSNSSIFVRGSFAAGNGCRYIVADSSGNLVSTAFTAGNGIQTLNLGAPTVLSGQSLTISCTLAASRWIGLAWQQ